MKVIRLGINLQLNAPTLGLCLSIAAVALTIKNIRIAMLHSIVLTSIQPRLIYPLSYPLLTLP